VGLSSEMGLPLGLAALLATIALTPAPASAGKFKCPAFTKLTSDPYIFKDPEQCDKYWTCVKGESRRSLCPDGLVFHPEKPDGEDPCDLKANVPDKCKSRPNQQRAKPGDAHCPRQYGVYPSSIPGECDTYYTCTNGKSAPTKCAEGLHYSDESGICVWARDSGRDDCDAAAEPKRKKKKGGAPVQEKKPDRKPADKLANGFVCPGGPIGVHPALPHPDDCRLYYVCLNGLDPSDAGCPPGKVFNPTIQQCDLPANVNGCEDYYNPAAKKKKAELASSLGADLKSDEFSMFIKLLKNSGVLKGNLLIPDKSASGGLSGKLGGRQGGGRAGRPGAGRLGPGRPGLGRPRGLHGGRPRKGGRLRGPGGRRRPRPRIPSYDYYDYDYDYDYQEAQPASPEAPAESRSFAQSPVGRRPRPPSQPQLPASEPANSVRATPIKSVAEEEATRRGDGVADTSRPSGRAGLFAIPAKRKNIFTSKFIPKVKMVGDTENLAPVPTLATLPPEHNFGPEQPARSPVLPEKGLSANDADTLFGALFPGLMATKPPTVVHPGLPEPVLLEVPLVKTPVREDEATEPRSRNSLFQRRPKPRPEPRKPAVVEEVKAALQAEEEPVRKAPVASIKSTGPRTRNSLFSRRQKPGRPVEQVEQGIRNLLTTTEPAAPSASTPRLGEEDVDEVIQAAQQSPRQNLFVPRTRFRPRSRPTSIRESTTVSTTLVTAAPNPSTPIEFTSTEHRFSSVATSEPFRPTTALPVSKRKGLRSFLKSRSRSPANGGRQSPAGGPRLPKPEPRISAGNRSPEPAAVPAALLPLPPTPALPGPRPVHQTAHLLDLAMTDFLPTPPPTFAPTTNAPEAVTTNTPVTLRRNTVTSAPQTPLPRINLDLQTAAPNIAASSRPQAVVPAFLQPSGGRSLSFPAPRARQFITDVPSPDSNVGAVPTSLLPRTQSFTAVQTPRNRGSLRHSSSSPAGTRVAVPQTELVRSSRGREVDSGENKHKVVMAARSQLKPFLPQAENEGDALEKLRAKIESLQSLNRHRGRG